MQRQLAARNAPNPEAEAARLSAARSASVKSFALKRKRCASGEWRKALRERLIFGSAKCLKETRGIFSIKT